jgi:hypothetical protein
MGGKIFAGIVMITLIISLIFNKQMAKYAVDIQRNLFHIDYDETEMRVIYYIGNIMILIICILVLIGVIS